MRKTDVWISFFLSKEKTNFSSFIDWSYLTRVSSKTKFNHLQIIRFLTAVQTFFTYLRQLVEGRP